MPSLDGGDSISLPVCIDGYWTDPPDGPGDWRDLRAVHADPDSTCTTEAIARALTSGRLAAPREEAPPPATELPAQRAEPAEEVPVTTAPRPQSLTVRRASSYVERETDWLWKPRIPLGHITIIDGDPDLGKSTVTLDLAARVSTGEPFPGETVRRAPMDVLVVSAEDSVHETMVPRLRVAGADLDRVIFTELERDPVTHRVVPLSLPEDLEKMYETIREEGVRLVIIDPITAFLSEDVNSHNDASVRKAMTPLKDVAERSGAAFLLVRHLNKSGDAKAMYRGGGSIAFSGAARSALLVAPHPDNEDVRVLCRVKGNLARTYSAWTYQFQEAGGQPRIEWLDTLVTSADDLLRGGDARTASPARDEARDFLIEVLGEAAVGADELRRLAGSAGLSWSTVRRAADKLGVVKDKVHGEDGRISGWTWSLPASEEWADLMRRSRR